MDSNLVVQAWALIQEYGGVQPVRRDLWHRGAGASGRARDSVLPSLAWTTIAEGLKYILMGDAEPYDIDLNAQRCIEAWRAALGSVDTRSRLRQNAIQNVQVPFLDFAGLLEALKANKLPNGDLATEPLHLIRTASDRLACIDAAFTGMQGQMSRPFAESLLAQFKETGSWLLRVCPSEYSGGLILSVLEKGESAGEPAAAGARAAHYGDGAAASRLPGQAAGGGGGKPVELPVPLQAAAIMQPASGRPPPAAPPGPHGASAPSGPPSSATGAAAPATPTAGRWMYPPPLAAAALLPLSRPGDSQYIQPARWIARVDGESASGGHARSGGGAAGALVDVRPKATAGGSFQVGGDATSGEGALEIDEDHWRSAVGTVRSAGFPWQSLSHVSSKAAAAPAGSAVQHVRLELAVDDNGDMVLREPEAAAGHPVAELSPSTGKRGSSVPFPFAFSHPSNIRAIFERTSQLQASMRLSSSMRGKQLPCPLPGALGESWGNSAASDMAAPGPSRRLFSLRYKSGTVAGRPVIPRELIGGATASEEQRPVIVIEFQNRDGNAKKTVIQCPGKPRDPRYQYSREVSASLDASTSLVDYWSHEDTDFLERPAVSKHAAVRHRWRQVRMWDGECRAARQHVDLSGLYAPDHPFAASCLPLLPNSARPMIRICIESWMQDSGASRNVWPAIAGTASHAMAQLGAFQGEGSRIGFVESLEVVSRVGREIKTNNLKSLPSRNRQQLAEPVLSEGRSRFIVDRSLPWAVRLGLPQIYAAEVSVGPAQNEGSFSTVYQATLSIAANIAIGFEGGTLVVKDKVGRSEAEVSAIVRLAQEHGEKVLRPDWISAQSTLQSHVQSVAPVRGLRHLTRVVGVIAPPRWMSTAGSMQCTLVLESAGPTSMQTWPVKGESIGVSLGMQQRLVICAQLAEAVASLHALGIAHCDIHLANLCLRVCSSTEAQLIQSQLQGKPFDEPMESPDVLDPTALSRDPYEAAYRGAPPGSSRTASTTHFWATLLDFGLSRRFNDLRPSDCYRPHAAPELTIGAVNSNARVGFSESTDMFALGCTMYSVLCRSHMHWQEWSTLRQSSKYGHLRPDLGRLLCSLLQDSGTCEDVDAVTWDQWVERSFPGLVDAEKQGLSDEVKLPEMASKVLRACFAKARPSASWVADAMWQIAGTTLPQQLRGAGGAASVSGIPGIWGRSAVGRAAQRLEQLTAELSDESFPHAESQPWEPTLPVRPEYDPRTGDAMGPLLDLRPGIRQRIAPLEADRSASVDQVTDPPNPLAADSVLSESGQQSTSDHEDDGSGSAIRDEERNEPRSSAGADSSTTPAASGSQDQQQTTSGTYRPTGEYPNGSVRLLMERVRSKQVVPFAGAGISNGLVPLWMPLLHWVYLKLLNFENASDVEQPTEAETKEFIDRLKQRRTGETEFTQEIIGRYGSGKFKKCVQMVIEEGVQSAADKCDEKYRSTGDSKWVVLAKANELTCHAALLTGAFPAVVTTNWDDIFEQSWKVIANMQKQLDSVSTSDVSEERQASLDCMVSAINKMCQLPVRHKGSYVEQRESSLLVIFRKDIKRLRAHLQGHSGAPALVKLHGDMSQQGLPEHVSSHEDFRHVMHLDVGTMQMLKMLASDYSLLFYGFKMEDQDVVAGLDQAVEVVGDVGPHFVLVRRKTREAFDSDLQEGRSREYTGDELEKKWEANKAAFDVRCKRLLQQQGVHTIYFEEYEHIKNFVVNVAQQGWGIPQEIDQEELQSFRVHPRISPSEGEGARSWTHDFRIACRRVSWQGLTEASSCDAEVALCVFPTVVGLNGSEHEGQQDADPSQQLSTYRLTGWMIGNLFESAGGSVEVKSLDPEIPDRRECRVPFRRAMRIEFPFGSVPEAQAASGAGADSLPEFATPAVYSVEAQRSNLASRRDEWEYATELQDKLPEQLPDDKFRQEAPTLVEMAAMSSRKVALYEATRHFLVRAVFDACERRRAEAERDGGHNGEGQADASRFFDEMPFNLPASSSQMQGRAAASSPRETPVAGAAEPSGSRVEGQMVDETAAPDSAGLEGGGSTGEQPQGSTTHGEGSASPRRIAHLAAMRKLDQLLAGSSEGSQPEGQSGPTAAGEHYQIKAIQNEAIWKKPLVLRIPVWGGMHGLGITEGLRIIASAAGEFIAECIRKHELPPITIELLVLPVGQDDPDAKSWIPDDPISLAISEGQLPLRRIVTRAVSGLMEVHVQVVRPGDNPHRSDEGRLMKSRKIQLEIRNGTLSNIARQLGMRSSELPLPKYLGNPDDIIAGTMGLLEGSSVIFSDISAPMPTRNGPTIDRVSSRTSGSAQGGGAPTSSGDDARSMPPVGGPMSGAGGAAGGGRHDSHAERDPHEAAGEEETNDFTPGSVMGGLVFQPPAEYGTRLLPAVHFEKHEPGPGGQWDSESKDIAMALRGWRRQIGNKALGKVLRGRPGIAWESEGDDSGFGGYLREEAPTRTEHAADASDDEEA